MSPKKKQTIEYRLMISPAYDEIRKKEKTVFLFETVKEFSTFNYKISIGYELNDKILSFRLMGLQTPDFTMPSFGPARKRIELPRLHGTHEVVITKIDGTQNSFKLKSLKDGFQIEDFTEQPFIIVAATNDEWKNIHAQPLKKST